MIAVSRNVLLVGAGFAAGAAILGYCLYFDQKRRRDPEFKRKLREKRQHEKKESSKESISSKKPLPPVDDAQQMQAYFLHEVQMGEELLSQGSIMEGVDHLCRAVAMCNSPEQLLSILRETLTPQLFNVLMQKLPGVRQRLAEEIQTQIEERSKHLGRVKRE